MAIIIGIDPGSQFTGYGIIAEQNYQPTVIDYGRIHSKYQSTAERLFHIYAELKQLIDHHQPQQMAIEQVFFHRNAQSALKLGQARGAALVAAAQQRLNIAEYSAKQIKQAVVGYGGAGKSQVQYMVRMLLKLTTMPSTDAADALAAALCHCQTQRLAGKLAAARLEEVNQ